MAEPAVRPRGRAVLQEAGVEITRGGVALVFARTDTKLWQDFIFPNAYSVLFLRRRVRFCRQDGTPGETATAPSALISFSAEDADVLARAVDPLRPDALSGFVVSLRR